MPGDLSSKLTALINVTSLAPVKLDSRVVPWDEGSADAAFTASVVADRAELSYGSVQRDVDLEPGNMAEQNVIAL